jgi:hypothetical protein
VRAHKRIVSLLLAIILIGSIVSVGSALDDGKPTVINFSPGDGAVLNTPDTVISFTVTDSSSPIKNSEYYIKVDGTEISSSLQYKGHYDSTNYVVDSYNEATVSGNVTGLMDGVHTVEVQAMNETGNPVNKTWTFTVAMAPVLSNQTPADQSDVSTATPNITVNVAYSGSDYNVGQAKLKIDAGSEVSWQITGSNPSYLLNYTAPAMQDGSHVVTLTIPNVADSTKNYTTTWSFNLKVPPVISRPSPDYTVTTKTPVLSAYATDNTGLASAVFTIDGQTVNGQIDTMYGRISAQVPTALADGSHNAVLSVSDSNGNVANTQWQFKVDTQLGLNYPDMQVNNNATCWSCHPKNFSFTAGTLNLADKHITPFQCKTCHVDTLGSKAKFRDCTACHYSNFFTTPPHSLKGAPPSVYRNLPNRQHPIKDIHLSSTNGCTLCHSRILTQEHNRLDKNNQQITCDTCHTGSYLAQEISTGGALRVDPTANWASGIHYLTWNTPSGTTISRIYLDMNSSFNLYDINALVDIPGGKNWARLNLSSTNIGTGKASYWIDLPVPAYGIQLKIYTNGTATGYIDMPKAITSVDKTDPRFIRVQNAIAQKDTNCTACHDEPHEQVHTNTLNDKCETCHANTLSVDHISNSTTQGKGYTCATCHASTNSNVQRAIVQNNVNCGACHKLGHNIPLDTSVPSDIPLYNGFTWTTPVEGAIFAGKITTPAGYETGQVVLSSRQNINVSDIWSFYNSELTAKLWVLQSGAPVDGANYFAAEFVKGSRKLMVRYFNTTLGDGTGAISSGYRIEIWYK